jgi:hypothetical protein
MRKYLNSRQNASSFCASIVTADKVPNASGGNILTAERIQDAAGWSTPTADRVPSTCAEILSRPTECHLHVRKYSHGRQSTSAFCASIKTADRVFVAIGRSTITAD